MSDNLNTWPERLFVAPKIYACGKAIPFTEADSYDLSETKHAIGGIEYIRADYALKILCERFAIREEKLIRAAIERGSSYGFNKDDFDTEERLIYEDAGLEKFDEHS